MSEIFEKAIVEKRNVLNEIRSNNMTVQELRFFSIYLSKINPWDTNTRKVRFSIDDFKRIMGFGRMNIHQLKSSTDSLLSKIVHVPDEKGGYTAFTLFNRCRVSRDENDQWFVEIDASDDALPLMFDFKNRYFKYELWNALRLKSPNQVRMYEILKQYEKVGRRELTISNLRELLGISPKDYSNRTGWSNFKKKVLDSCQQALKENTDLCYTYERGRSGSGGKWLTIVFHISRNKDYKDPLSLEMFIDMQPKPGIDSPEKESIQTSPKEESGKNDSLDFADPHLKALYEACDSEFSMEDIEMLFNKISAFVPEKGQASYLNVKYREMMYRDSKLRKNGKKIDNHFGYIKKMIDSDYIQHLQIIYSDTKKEDGYEAGYDISEYESHSVTDEEW